METITSWPAGHLGATAWIVLFAVVVCAILRITSGRWVFTRLNVCKLACLLFLVYAAARGAF